MLIGNFLTHEERQLAGLTQVEARVTGRPDPDAPLETMGGTKDPDLLALIPRTPNYAQISHQ